MATWRGLDTNAETIENDRTLTLADIEFELKSRSGTALLQQQDTITMAFDEANLEFPIPLSERVVLGRREFNKPELVDIDLTPYGAREKGVSRRHAALYRTSHILSLVDLGSSNGTYLNGTRLLPHRPRLVRSDDEVAFGTMVFKIHFEKFSQVVS